MKFSNQLFLYGLLIIPVLWLLLNITGSLQERKIKVFSDNRLFKRLASGVNYFGRRIKWILMVLAIALMIVALAGPQLGSHTIMVKREGIDIMIAVDTSVSMLAEDGGRPPNRLTRAKFEIASLIDEKLQGDRVGVVAFAGDAFVQCPLTIDYSAAKLFLDIMDTDLIPVHGTNLERAIEVSASAFKDTEKKHKVMIIITDGEGHEGEPVNAAEKAAEQGIVIYTIGVGSAEGEPIPMRGPAGNLVGYKKDSQGNIVMSTLDDSILRKIAEASNGKYFHATAGGNELDKIYNEISGMDKKEFEGKLMTIYEERFQYPLIAGIILLAMEMIVPERRKRNESI
ncbi:MAG: VWA domain-containing protein [candidate division Zixibacteria bacterium]|nr:VWA domain-containing protein [candidate division Zixibacteria bacterium]